MRSGYRFMGVTLAIGLALIASGCGGREATIRATVRRAVGDQRIRVAILPFDNLSQRAGADRAVTQVITTYLLASELFEVIEPGYVTKMLVDMRIRSVTEELDPDTARDLGQKLNAELLLLGAVQEYGEVRIVSDTYPAVSLSARIVDAYTGSILCSASAAQTGADTVVVFDFGRVNSLPRLTQIVVEKMTRNLQQAGPRILEAVKAAREGKGASARPGPAPAPTPASAPSPGAAPAAPSVPGAVLSEDQLRGLLREVSGFSRSAVEYSKHVYGTAEASYEGGGRKVTARLVDYTSADQARQFLAAEHPGQTAGSFANLPAYAGESQFGILHLNVVVGRFGLYLSGPVDAKDTVERVGRGLISGLQEVR